MQVSLSSETQVGSSIVTIGAQMLAYKHRLHPAVDKVTQCVCTSACPNSTSMYCMQVDAIV